MFTLWIKYLNTPLVCKFLYYVFWRFPVPLHIFILVPCSNKFTYTGSTHIQLIAIVINYGFHVIAHFASISDHVEHDTGV